ncbi:MAG TPA: hypothetical protein VIL74_16580 [Pyrinomonadaceae bacterium]|jgi:hypothetical protein
MSKTSLLKIAAGLFAVAAFSVFYAVQTERAAAQKRKASAKTKSLCRADEQTIWSCATTKNKIASVCASKDLAEDKGYLQYRFGTAGRIELEYPAERPGSAKKFKYSRYTRPLVTMLALSFENNGVKYEIHDDDNSEEKPPVRAASVDVANSSVVCKLPTAGSLMKLEDIVPRNEEN